MPEDENNNIVDINKNQKPDNENSGLSFSINVEMLFGDDDEIIGHSLNGEKEYLEKSEIIKFPKDS